MKIYHLIVSLLFSTSVFADDISDFEIEGITIGNSALMYLSEIEIKNEVKLNSYMYEYLEKGKFGHVILNDNLTTYDFANIMIKLDDNNYTIHKVVGIISFTEDMDGCLNKRDEIFEELSPLFKNTTTDKEIKKHPVDSSGKSITNSRTFWFMSGNEYNGDVIALSCSNFDENLRKKNNWIEGLSITTVTKELNDWLNNY
tara:strand:+ start:719 stop:1318 length:600 start_codon:yes stop_codon:yes gene_type:complete